MRALPRATTSERTSGVAASSGSKERLRDQCDASPAGRRWSAWAFLKGRGAAVSWLGSIFIKLLCSESTIDTAVQNLSTFLKLFCAAAGPDTRPRTWLYSTIHQTDLRHADLDGKIPPSLFIPLPPFP